MHATPLDALPGTAATHFKLHFFAAVHALLEGLDQALGSH